MGILLVGGFFAVAGIVAMKLGKPQPKQAVMSEACEPQQFTLPDGFRIMQSSQENGHILMTLSSATQQRFIALDNCSGTIVSDIIVK